jgi:hypothetical protein
MGWLKRAARAVVRGVKAAVRLVVRIVTTFVGLVVGVFDLFLGFLTWPEKKLRLHIFILSDQNGPLVTEAQLQTAINFAKTTFKNRLNVKVLPYGKPMVEIIKEPAPHAALNVGCNLTAFGEEFAEAGDFFAKHVAGWNAAPVSGTFPITVFIVKNISGKAGCSMGPLTDYVTIEQAGASEPSLMAHELGHACSLFWHEPWNQSNLMYAGSSRGDRVNALQKNLFRSSRHVLYW